MKSKAREAVLERDSHVALVGSFEWTVRWLVLVILMLLPLDAYLVLPGNQPVAFLSQILTAESLVVLVAGLLVASILGRPISLSFDWRTLIPLALVVLVAFASVLGASLRSQAVKGCFKLAVYLGLYALARAVAALPGIRRSALQIIVIAYCVVLLVGFLGTIPGTPDVAGAVLNIQRSSADVLGSAGLVLRAEATFRYPNELAAYLLLVIPVLIAFAIRAPSRLERLAYWTSVTLGSGLLTLTYTRGALVALILIVPLVAALAGGRKYGLGAVLMVLAVGAAVILKDGVQRTRLLTILDLNSSGYSIRFSIWQWALHAVRTHPLFGVGVGNLRYQPKAPLANVTLHQPATDAENLFLNVMAEMGLAGLLAVGTCFVGALRQAWQSWQRGGNWFDQSWNAGMLGAMCAILLYGFVDPVLVSGQVTGLLVVLVGLSGPGIVTAVAARPERAPVSASILRRTPEMSVEAAAPVAGHNVGLLARLDARVVFLVNSSGMGGAERHALHLAADLLARGVDVLVVCPPGAPLVVELADRGIPSRAISLGMSLGRWRGYLGTAAFINPFSRDVFNRAVVALAAETPSIFVCPFLREQLLGARLSRRRGLRTVWVIHAPIHYRPHRALLRWLFVQRAQAASAIVPVSRGMAEGLAAEGLDRASLRVVPNAVADVPPETSPTAVAAALAARPLDIAVASRLTRGKGVQHLIAALPAILEAVPDARLLIAGAGRYERALRAAARRGGLDEHVAFLGQLPDTEWLLESARVFVCPSTDPGEVLPTAVLEAMSRGVPVVATNIGSMAEVIRHEETGLLVAGGDSAALAGAITRLLSDPVEAASLAFAGQELVRTWYTFDRAGLAFLHLLRLIEEATRVAKPAAKPPAPSRVPTPPVAPAEGAAGVDVGATSGMLQAVNRARFLRTTVVLFASKVLTALATSLWTILAARALLPRAYGNLMLAAGIVELGAIITDAGLTTVATRELANASYEQARTLVGAIVAIKVALGLVATAVIVAIALAVPMEADARKVLFVLGPSLLFVSLNSLTLVFRARVSAWQVLGVALLGALVTTYGTVLVYLGFPAVLHFAQTRLLAALSSGLLALLLVLARYRPRPRPDGAVVRRLLLAALPLGVALALNIAYYRLDVPLLAILRGSTQVATYTAAYRILDVVTLLPGAAAVMALPLMSGIAERNERHLAVFVTQYLEIAAACGLLIALLIALFGNPLLAFLYAGKYAASSSTLTVLGWVGAATFVTNVFAPLAIVLDRQRAFLTVAGAGLVVNVAINLALIPAWGPLGAATATLLTEFVIIGPLAWIAYQRLRLRFLTRPLVSVAVATAVAVLAGTLPHAAGWDVALKVGAVALWGALVFALAPRWVLGLLATATHRDRLSDSLARGRSPVDGSALGEGKP
jgi:O-antigen/teichoic acid export membrane protein/glycosyltransferase involved in cell wall biosynthesis/O-antigen ligase